MSTASKEGVLNLVRDDLRSFAGYSSARTESLQGDVWLNANESAWANPADERGSNRRYPDPQPQALRERLAALYGCDVSQLLIGRGSDEAIDLLVRTLCRPGVDAVVITPPVFGMYAVCARLQNAPLLAVPLVERQGADGDANFEAELDAIADVALEGRARLVFLCSPSNPTGGSIPLADIEALAQRLAGRTLVVVDEAYGEFSDTASAVGLIERNPNIAVLRTLSKAHALAAARIGSLIADASLVAVLRRCQAPYPVPAPCAELALAALSDDALARSRQRVETVKAERERLRAVLAELPEVIRVYPSQGNYLLVRFRDAEKAFRALLDAGVVVRDQRAVQQLDDALRITIGTPEQNAMVLETLQRLEPGLRAVSA